MQDSSYPFIAVSPDGIAVFRNQEDEQVCACVEFKTQIAESKPVVAETVAKEYG